MRATSKDLTGHEQVNKVRRRATASCRMADSWEARADQRDTTEAIPKSPRCRKAIRSAGFASTIMRATKILRMKKTGSPVDFRCWRAGSVDLLPGGGSEEPGVSLPPMRATHQRRQECRTTEPCV
jgi:hypothetical protein